jgi:tetratricopeptide (TPR) repeat protein
MAAEIHLMRDEWNKALGMAQLGLELTPTHVDCLNAQAMALTKLGRIKEAEDAVELALSEDPENHVSHANRASILFRRGKPNEAAEHYREALRLNPNSKWAREGILEALKSRNPIYYPFAFISAKLSDMDRRTSIAFALVLMFVPPLRALMFLFLLLSLAAKKFFNLVLLTDSFGKRILTDDEKNSTACFGVWLLCLLGSTTAVILMHKAEALAPVVISTQLLFLMPLIKVFDVEKGLRRQILSGLTVVTGAIGIYVMATSIIGGQGFDDFTKLQKTLHGFFILACLLSVFYPHGKANQLH